jgi:hypothetical protein
LTSADDSRSIAAMIDTPRISTTKRAEIAPREARLSRALRDNLRRRKEQARAREQPAANLPDGGSPRDDLPKGKGSGGKPPA